ncbi:MAG: superoxide dismutase [Bacteroidales bacterium]|nr:superoxide dismutase [Bacteroidales bacterium]MBN2697319.1 superoxide dismutase [Bacteroidales bacterium]
MNKRNFLKHTAALGAGALIAPSLLTSFTIPGDRVKAGLTGQTGFQQPELNYAFDALEPYIDRRTMELHYSKHHAGYTQKLNEALGREGITEDNILRILENISSYGAAVRNNGGGYYNHNLYWNFMSPEGGGTPRGKIGKAIRKQFGSFEAFKEQFSSVAASHFGSGWAWLIVKPNGQLQVVSTPNQDNPLMDVSEVKGSPVLNIDVWEHAYYLNYQNQRARYIEAYWNIIDWDYVEHLYREAVQ